MQQNNKPQNSSEHSRFSHPTVGKKQSRNENTASGFKSKSAKSNAFKPSGGTSKTGKTASKFGNNQSGSKKDNRYTSQSASKGTAKSIPARKAPEKKPAIPKLPEGWLLFSDHSLTASDIRNIFPEDRDVDVWTAAGVVEIVLGDKLTMDIEQLEIPQQPEEDAAWYAEQGIVSQFYITFDREGYQQAMADLKMIVKELHVQICGDTEDLTPVIE